MEGVFTPLALVSAVIAVSAMLVNFVIVAVRMPRLPDEVPSHYGLTGKPDAWMGKAIIWIFPGMSFMCLLLLGGTLTGMIMELGESASRETEMACGMTAFITVMTLVITIRAFAVAEKCADGLGWWMTPVFAIGTILTPLCYYLARK